MATNQPFGTENLLRQLRRMAELDRRLAGEGMLVSEVAREWKVSTKTVHRMLAVLRTMTGTEIAGGNQRPYRRRYADRRKRLFRPVATVNVERNA